MPVLEVRALPASLAGGRVAQVIGIPHYILNFERQFDEHVVSNFVREYEAGRTPLPCTHCNADLKFATLAERDSVDSFYRGDIAPERNINRAASAAVGARCSRTALPSPGGGGCRSGAHQATRAQLGSMYGTAGTGRGDG